MGSSNICWFLLLFFSLASMIPTLSANIAQWDEYWTQRKAEALKQTKKVFDESSDEVLTKLYNEKIQSKDKPNHEGKLLAKAEAEDKAELHHAKAKAEAKTLVKAKPEAEAEDEDEAELHHAKAKEESTLKLDAEGKLKTKSKKTEKKTKMAAKRKPLRASNNSTRRALRGRKYRGPCMATNTIDRCWRCDKNWALNRKKLADCARGFGQKARGGKNGRIYVVTDPSDFDVVNPKPGTLRHAVIQLQPLWIIFARSMTIKLSQELIMTSDKTIDGRGVNVHIAYGAGITIQFVKNIIIHSLHIHHISESSGGLIRDSVNHVGFRTHNEGDGISVFGSRDIWLDHLSMSNCKDGLIDAVQGSTGITISNSHFTDHDKVMLFGASDFTDVDDKMQITVAFNHFGKRLVQRMPRCRSGFFHLVNNDYTHWEMYAIGGSHHATIISQGNRFIAPPNLPPSRKSMVEITHRNPSGMPDDWKKWTWVSDGDIFQNGAFFTPSGDLNGARTYAALELIKPSPAKKVGRLTRFSGALRCTIGRPC